MQVNEIANGEIVLEDCDVRSVYVAGPMRGYEKFNFPAFAAATAALREKGLRVISPAEDDLEVGFNPDEGSLVDFDMNAAVRRDVEAILTVDAVVVLPGHEKSSGATAERAIAGWLGKPVLGVYPNLDVLPKLTDVDRWADWSEQVTKTPTVNESVDILLEALQLTTGDRQASYGPPDQDFRRTANMWNALFADFFKEGCGFEPFHVAQAMILLKQSRQLHQRKRDNWSDTAGYARCGQLCDEAAKSEAGR